MLFLEAVIATVIGSCLCSILGLYISRLGLSTLVFTVAHAALAGAALALILGLDVTTAALGLSMITALALGVLSSRLGPSREALCMTLFSLFNALALLAIYYSNSLVLATSTLAAVLWGSVLAVTMEKLVALIAISIVFAIYVAAFRKHLDALLFDRKLAEAEGLSVCIHTATLLAIASVSISLMLRIVGGFLVFTLLYVPTVFVSILQLSTKQQLRVAPLFGSLASCIGLYVSYALDLPVGVSIALSNVLGLGIAIPMKMLFEKIARAKSVNE